MNRLVEARTTLPTKTSEAELIGAAAQADAGFDKMLKFNKGVYICDGEEVPLGTEFTAHCLGWTKMWIMFEGNRPVERKVYRVIKGEVPPERFDLPYTDPTKWEHDPAGRPRDPWSLQYLLPLEFSNEEVVIFTTGTVGGRRAVADLCAAYSRKRVKDPGCGLPLIKIGKTTMPSKKWGDVLRPNFEIIAWAHGSEAVREVQASDLKSELDDDIPF